MAAIDLPPARIAAAVLGVLAIGFGVASWSLGYWVDGTPGPGVLPLCASLLLLPTVVWLLRVPLEPDDEPGLSARSLGALMMFGVCAFAMPQAGIAIPSAVLALLWMRFFGERSWLASAAYSLVMVAVLAGLFIGALKVPIPLFPDLR
ncbi:MAG TPA: tripartite tricarboxylate transporter TctB family protein [Burkholderiaceae bacterium]|nr:tripartite tricarboxylate transporter TctB family protein [Burkholderiaceae bacterium]